MRCFRAVGVFVLSVLVVAVVIHVSAVPLPLAIHKFRAERAAAAAARAFVEADVNVDVDDALYLDAESEEEVDADADEEADAEVGVVVDAAAAARARVGVPVAHPVTIVFGNVAGAPLAALPPAAVNPCTLVMDTAGVVVVNDAMIVALRTCPSLLAHLGLDPGSQALVTGLVGATWVASVTVTGSPPTVWGGNAPAAPLATAVTITLNALNRVQAQVYTTANAADGGHTAACYYGVNGAAFVHTNAIFVECARSVTARIETLQGLGGGVLRYAFAQAADQEGNPALNAQFGANTVLQVREPVLVTVLRDAAGAALQASIRTWVSRAAAANWDAALVGAVNAHHNMVNAAGGAAVITGGQAVDAVLQHNGAGNVDWGQAIPNRHQAIRIELFQRVGGHLARAYFADVNSAQSAGSNVYPGVAQTPNLVLNTAPAGGGAASQHVFYLNTVSGQYAGINAANARATAVAAGLAAAQGVATNAMTPGGVYGALTGEAALMGGVSQNLYDVMRQQHGNVNAHFGYAYFEITVSFHKTITPVTRAERPRKVIGWICGADNVQYNGYVPAHPNQSDGAGLHTEQRCLEQLRRFVRALEVAANGVTMVVEDMRSRWITDFFPDRTYVNNCQFLFEMLNRYVAAGHFRTLQYDDTVRQIRSAVYDNTYANTAGAAGVKRAAAVAAMAAVGHNAVSGAIAALANPIAATVIGWTAPVGHNIIVGGVRGAGAAYNIPVLPP